MNWVVYMLECADKSLYTGITTNLERRLAEHAAGRGAKYTQRAWSFPAGLQRNLCGQGRGHQARSRDQIDGQSQKVFTVFVIRRLDWHHTQ